MNSNLNPDYISYKVYFMPEVHAQRIKVSKVPKLFITINEQPYFPKVIESYDSIFNFRYMILPNLTAKIFDTLALATPEYIHA